jgi:TldD protein
MDSRSLEAVIETALSRRVDHADLFFEYTTRDAVVLEEGIVKSGDRHLEQGVGVRAQAGERQGYAHSDEVSADSAMLAASTARAISEGPASPGAVAVGGSAAPASDLYPVQTAPTDVPVGAKIAVLNEIDAHARRADPRIKQVMASIVAEHRNILIAASDGTLVTDVRPLIRVNVQVIAENPQGRRETGYQGAGGRFDLARLLRPEGWKPIADEAVRSALVNLEAKPCPAGTMDVVLGPGWPGILLHEAIGHGLEGDFNRKKTSAFSDKLGERVAAEGVTVIDDGTIAERRGSLNVDDEGTATQRTC